MLFCCSVQLFSIYQIHTEILALTNEDVLLLFSIKRKITFMWQVVIILSFAEI